MKSQSEKTNRSSHKDTDISLIGAQVFHLLGSCLRDDGFSLVYSHTVLNSGICTSHSEPEQKAGQGTEELACPLKATSLITKTSRKGRAPQLFTHLESISSLL